MNNETYLCYARSSHRIQTLKNVLRQPLGKPDGEKLRRLMWNMRRSIPYPLGTRHPTEHSFALKRRLRFRAGIKHMANELRLLLKEAFYLNCTPVIPHLMLHPKHNLGIDANHSVSEYYDLPASFLITKKGEKKSLSYILAKDFFQLHGDYRLRFFSLERTILPQEVTKKTIIIRKTRSMAHINLENKPALYDFCNNTRVHLELAAPIKQMAEEVTAKLGRYYVLRCRLPWDRHQPYRIKRVKKHLAKRPEDISTLQYFFSGEGLCRQLIKVFPPGSKLFIAANLWPPYDEDYFGPLRRLYKVYRYYDFPKLAGLTARKNPNTAKLHLIEQIIEQHSIDKILVDFMYPDRTGRNLQKLVKIPESSPPENFLLSQSS